MLFPSAPQPAESPAMAISFCTACANRLFQLERVFAANAAILAQHADVEWVLVNFGSRDKLDAFVAARRSSLPARFVYGRVAGAPAWHASVAKNVAHRAARGRILVNLDADNRIGDAVATIRAFFAQGCTVLHLWSGVMNDGTFGRIAVQRELFEELGGYDESFYPMGYQDFDLLRRATAAGHFVLHAPCAPGTAVPNTKEDSIRHCAEPALTWRDYNDHNRLQSRANIAAGRLVANAGRQPGPACERLLGGRTAR
jgi:hypothetical protein